jgi:hypothetical protein
MVWELLGLRLIRLTSGTSLSGVEEAVRIMVVLVLIVPLPRLWFVVSIDHLTRLAPEPTHDMPTRWHLEQVGWTSSHFFFCFLHASQARPDGTPGIARLHEASHGKGGS